MGRETESETARLRDARGVRKSSPLFMIKRKKWRKLSDCMAARKRILTRESAQTFEE
jgi:hypothetical protein